MSTQGDSPARITVTRRDDTVGGSHLAATRSRYFLRAEQTGGAFSMSEIVFAPGAQGTPWHVHTREEETYYVIDGALLAEAGDQAVTLGPGDSIVLPRDVPHRVTPVGDQMSRILMIITPPGLEGMLERLDAASDGALDMPALLALAGEYGVRILDGKPG